MLSDPREIIHPSSGAGIEVTSSYDITQTCPSYVPKFVASPVLVCLWYARAADITAYETLIEWDTTLLSSEIY